MVFKHFIDKGLYCFNYHRIGDPTRTDFDPNVFSCTAETFETHLRFFNEHFIVVSVEEIQKLTSEELSNNRYALITFDDGYRDNYLEAFPLLREHKTPAVFFLATDFIDDQITPWWDLIAYYIKTTLKPNIHLKGWPNRVDLTKDQTAAIREILTFVKANHLLPICDQVQAIKQELDIDDLPPSQQLFMSWPEAKEMVDHGMSVGSQTCSHRILSHLSVDEQKEELIESKRKIEQQLGINDISFAYPVGNGDSFTRDTVELVSKLYPIAFSFMSGVNKDLTKQRHAIKRFSIDNNCSSKELAYRLVRNKISQM